MADEWVSMTLEWKSDFRPDAVTSVTKLQGSPTRYLLTDQSGKTATLSGTDKGRAEPTIDGVKLVVDVTLPESNPTACGDLIGNVIDTARQPVADASMALGFAPKTAWA
jgi:hypothetical protein